MAAATLPTASVNAGSDVCDGVVTPLTLRTYCLAAASISSGVAAGSSPRSVVMLRHMRTTIRPA